MLGHHQLHDAFVVQVIAHIDKHFINHGFLSRNDFQPLAVRIEVILFMVVDCDGYVRISTEIFLQDIVIMGIERSAVHDGLQMFSDIVPDNDKHVRRVVFCVLGKDFNRVPYGVLCVFRSQQHFIFAWFRIGIERILFSGINDS